MLSVKFFDPGLEYRKNRDERLRVIDDVLSRGDLILRKDVKEFEENLAHYVGTRFAVGVTSGTDALYLSLKVLGIKEGDEVITVSNTFKATITTILQVGAKPILVEVGDDYLMDISKIEEKISDKTKAIIPVHLSGDMANMVEISYLAKQYDLYVIEDAAQALGATLGGKKAGSWGTTGCFSFYPAKLLGAYGDAGAITTNDPDIYNELLGMRNHYKEGVGLGGNYRLDNLQAAILNSKFKDFQTYLDRRKQIAKMYDVLDVVVIPKKREVYQDYIIRAKDRDNLYKFLEDNGIETMIPPVLPHIELELSERLIKSEIYNESFLRLPCNPELTDAQVYYVIEKIIEFYA